MLHDARRTSATWKHKLQRDLFANALIMTTMAVSSPLSPIMNVSKLLLLLTCSLLQSFSVCAYIVPPNLVSARRISPTPPLHMAGFGARDKKPEPKIKPKAQWDRYTDMKKEPIVRVAIKKGDEWLEVGRVRSKGNAYTEIAVARQRALIADVSTLFSGTHQHEMPFSYMNVVTCVL